MSAHPACEPADHEWADAGGDLLICMVCEAESWASEQTAAYERHHGPEEAER